jgi:hypothetical protein
MALTMTKLSNHYKNQSKQCASSRKNETLQFPEYECEELCKLAETLEGRQADHNVGTC